MSKELIDADKGMSLSKGSYLGVIIDVEEETYNGNFIPVLDGKSLSKLIFADASYCNFSSLDLSEILC